MKQHLILRYAAMGAVFGLLFPIASVAVTAWGMTEMPMLADLLAATHAVSPLLYVIDTAPLFLGLFAAFAGVRQQRLAELNASLAREVAEQTASLRDALRRAEKTNLMISHMADHDPLTGLLNRRRMLKEIASAVATGKRHGDPFTLVFLDLDRFKAINDSHGHDAGDRFLAGFAALLERRVREYDRVGRWGGDEFVILLPKLSPREAGQFAGALEQFIAQQVIDVGACRIAPSSSAGVAVFPDDGSDAETLLAAADRQMYQVKRQRSGARLAAEAGAATVA